MHQKGFASVLLILVVIALAASGYLYYQNQQKQESNKVLSTPTPTISSEDVYREEEPLPVEKEAISPSKTKSVQVNGADVKNIKYTLPNGWLAKINGSKLEISKGELDGYVYVEVHTYNEQEGRRAFYCKTTDVCIDGQTKFTTMEIGNISGYQPFPIDNSGGGPEYFGAKGNKFYRISTNCTLQNPDEFDPNNECNTNRMNILKSFIF